MLGDHLSQEFGRPIQLCDKPPCRAGHFVRSSGQYLLHLQPDTLCGPHLELGDLRDLTRDLAHGFYRLSRAVPQVLGDRVIAVIRFPIALPKLPGWKLTSQAIAGMSFQEKVSGVFASDYWPDFHAHFVLGAPVDLSWVISALAIWATVAISGISIASSVWIRRPIAVLVLPTALFWGGAFLAQGGWSQAWGPVEGPKISRDFAGTSVLSGGRPALQRPTYAPGPGAHATGGGVVSNTRVERHVSRLAANHRHLSLGVWM